MFLSCNVWRFGVDVWNKLDCIVFNIKIKCVYEYRVYIIWLVVNVDLLFG